MRRASSPAAPARFPVSVSWIKAHNSAVNHGINAGANAGAAAEDMDAAISDAKAFEQLDDSLKISKNDSDMKMLARYRRIEGMLQTNLPDGPEAVRDREDDADERQHRKFAVERQCMEEQRPWDQHNLKAELRRRLTEFIATAESVDFAAQT